jgi:alginate O-acetyltransferase complex protein AlgJ
MVYPDMLDSTLKASMGESMTRLDPVHQQFYKLLQDKGITVLDLVPAFTAARFDGKGDPYCKQDSHWSGRGCEIAARHIIKTLKGQTWLEAVTKQPWDTQAGELQLRGDLWKAVNGEKPKQETLALRFVGKKDSGPLQPVQPDKNSPVILMGDSHTLVFQAGEDMHARGAGLADQLARELGFAVDLIGVRGSGATPTRITLFRRARSDANYLKNKKLLIWCFSAREFTEAVTGWRKVPVVK